MENPRPEKVAVVEEVRERLSSTSAAILTEYRGLGVKELSTLRRALGAAGGDFKIYKNTLVRFAARDLGLDELDAMLTGPTAIAFVDGDAVAVAKALRDFSRTNPALVVKGGLLGTSVLSAPDTAALADLPSREVLLARIAGGLAAPMVKFAGLLQALPRNFAYGLKALVDQLGGVPEEDVEPEAEPEAAAPAPEPAPEPEAAAPAPEPEAPAEAELAPAETEMVVVVDPQGAGEPPGAASAPDDRAAAPGPADEAETPTPLSDHPESAAQTTGGPSGPSEGLKRALSQLPRQQPDDPAPTTPSDSQATETEQ